MSKTLKEKRIELHDKLQEIAGLNKVYFQPPEGPKIEYPCIIYERYDMPIKYADNENYNIRCKYKITVIDKVPDSDLVDKMSKFKGAKFNRHFASNGLNHDIFIVYY